MAFYLISSMVSGLLDQLQIFWQLILIELLRILIGLGLLKLNHLYLRLSTGFSMLVFFTNLNLIAFLVRYFDVFDIFSVIDVFECL